MFRVVKGDLFSEQIQPLCHCISADYAMSMGIAVTFKNIFGKPIEKVDIGKIVITKHPVTGQIAFNMVTKQNYWNKPTIHSIMDCLEEVAKYCRDHNIDSVSMPRIGCGLDKLKWIEVESAIRKILKDINVTVYEPSISNLERLYLRN